MTMGEMRLISHSIVVEKRWEVLPRSWNRGKLREKGKFFKVCGNEDISSGYLDPFLSNYWWLIEGIGGRESVVNLHHFLPSA